MKIERFTVSVNCYIEDQNPATEQVQDHIENYDDLGFIMLPESYSDSGESTRLVICCHGAGGSVSINDSQVEHSVLAQYLVANGYAVMDVNGLPQKFADKKGIDIKNNIGSPIALRSYVKAYHYCMDRYNLKPDVFVHGGSMGGISGTNLVLSGAIPVIAHTAYCPVLDAYNEVFLHPWGYGVSKEALSKIYGFKTDENGEYIYDAAKVIGYNPMENKKAEYYPVPVKFWHAIDDEMVSYDITKRFIDRIKENGGIAYLRTLPCGGHGPHLVGENVEHPIGNDVCNGVKLEIKPIMEEAFIFITNLDGSYKLVKHEK